MIQFQLLDKQLLALHKVANEIRQDIIMMLQRAGSGHAAGSLDATDILTALYFKVLNIDPKKPQMAERDRFVLSCGHIAPALYAALARRGYFSLRELDRLRAINSPLQGHPLYQSLPGIENSSGPLGQGLSQALGMAIAGRADKQRYQVYVLMSDGEQQEGQTWEAVMLAGHLGLSNLTAFIDRNNIQIDGRTEAINGLEPLADKYRAFGWYVLEVDGHNIEQIVEACGEAKAVGERPSVIICHTIAGKGVSFMEDNHLWHGRAPDQEEAKAALRELRSLDRRQT